MGNNIPISTMNNESQCNQSYCGREMVSMADLKEILNVIEELREKLGKISREKTLTDHEVLAASQMLDAALNEYQKLMKNKANRS